MSQPQKRGPYKKYLLPDSDHEVPKRTRNYWKAKERAKNIKARTDFLDGDNNDVIKNLVLDVMKNPNQDHVEAEDVNQLSETARISEDTNFETSDSESQQYYAVEESQLDEDHYNYCYSSASSNKESDTSSESGNEDLSNNFQQNNDCNPIEVPSCSQRNNLSEEADDPSFAADSNNRQATNYSKDVLIRTLLILATKIRKNLDNEVVTHMANLIDAISNEPLHFTSTYYLKDIINQYAIPIEIHHFCPSCLTYIGMESTVSEDNPNMDNGSEDQQRYCNKCNLNVNCSNNKQSGNIFLYLSLTKQLQKFCEHHHQDLLYPNNRDKTCSYALEDILDGHLYKQRFSEEELRDMISINFSIDGTPLFKSSLTSITPIVCTINEIHPKKRQQFIILASENFYLGARIDEIDKLLVSFKPSMDVSRSPRKISDRVHFKAHELVIWLLFYSLPVLNRFLPSKYVYHWSLLVEAISLLLKTSILETEVYYSQRCLFKFVKGIETLYGKEHLSFNVHLLTHIPASVINWGPLWCHSAFCYENFHQFLKKLVKSSNAAGQQILESIRSQIAMEKLQDIYEIDLTFRQRQYLHNLLNKRRKPKVSSSIEDIGLIGQPITVKEMQMDYFLTLQRINITTDKDTCIKFYKRILINDEVIHSKEYLKVKKRNSYTVLLKNNEIFEIKTFILITIANNLQLYALGKYFIRHRHRFHETRQEHLYFGSLSESLTAVNANMIDQKVTFLSSPQYAISVACKHPNKFEMLT